uniref:Pancreatic trypsin inhibitor n=1 Tax=Rhipicephalus appendiculatus TaxID=34631 RepID=A0A131YTT5_RHIAP
MLVLLLAIFTAACAPCIAVKSDLSGRCTFKPKDLGNEICHHPKTAWYFNNSTSKCKVLKNVCKTDEPMFRSKKECKQECEKSVSRPKMPRLCRQQPQKGKCKADFSRWFWSSGQGCREYRGCYTGGFFNQKQCRQKCGGTPTWSKPKPRENPKLRSTAE